MLCCSDKFSLWNAAFYSTYQLSCWINTLKLTCYSNSNHPFYKSKRKICVYPTWYHIKFDEIWCTIFLHWYNLHDLYWCEIFFSSLSQYLLRETCYKNYNYDNGTFLRKEVKFSSVRHNLKFNCVKMPVLETHFKIFNLLYFLYIQHVVTRNQFTSFKIWKLETLAFLTVKESLYTNLLRTIISSFINKNYYYIVILFLLYFPSCI